jgi:hypothetical protein
MVLRWTIALGLLLTWPASVRAQEAPSASAPVATARVRLAVSAGVNGEYAPVACGATPHRPALATVAAGLASAGPGALRIDAGDLLGSAALSRLLLDRDPGAVAAVVDATGLRAIALGHNDLAAPRATLLAGARALAARGLRPVLGNLRCEPGQRALCDAVVDAGDPPLVLDTEAGRVGFVSAIVPTALRNVARDGAAGLELEPPAAAIARATAAARSAGATFVVAVYDPEWGDEVRDGLALAGHFAGTSGPDVLLINGASERLASATVPGGRTLVVGTRRQQVVLVEPGTADSVRESEVGAVPEPVARFVADANRWLCEHHDRPLAGGALQRPMDEAGFAALLLGVLREHARAEVAVINRGAFAAAGIFPLENAITALQVVAALPFDNQLRVARIRGSVLKDFARSSRAAFFYTAGLEVDGDHVRINGRQVDADLDYRVVTIDYVADGGDGGIGDTLGPWEPYGGDAARDVFLAWLAQPRRGDITTAPVDPAQRTRWTLRYTLDGALTSVAVANPDVRIGAAPMAAFSDAQLVRAASFSLRGETEFRADADHPVYSLENLARLRYGVIATTPREGASTGLVENIDLIHGRVTGVWRPFRDEHPVPWHPLPFLDAYLESEFTRPSTRAYHHLELRPTVGARFQLFDPFSVYVGGGITWEMLAQREQLLPVGPPLVPALVAGWALRPGVLFTLLGRNVEGETTLDMLWRDPLGNPGMQIRFNGKLSLPLFEPIALTVGYALFARMDRFVEPDAMMNPVARDVWGFAGDLTVGLKVTYARAIQAFAF